MTEDIAKLVDEMVWEGLEGDMPLLMFHDGKIGIQYDTLENAEADRDKLREAWGDEIESLRNSAIEAVLEDLEQDLIAEMYASDHKFTKSDVVWNQALQFAIERLRTYSKE